MSITRRHLLELSAAAFVATLSGCAQTACVRALGNLTEAALREDGDLPVVIVGAGVSGLAAAKALTNAGVPVVILDSGLAVEDIAAQAQASLEAALGRDLGTPTDVAVTTWRRDPYARGSYSMPTLGSSWESYAVRAEPVDGRLLFAGEHTDAALSSTVHGAMVTGLREARRIHPEAELPGLC